jgi:hypothetical protein
VLHVNSKVISKKQSKSHGRQIKDSEHRKEREREREREREIQKLGGKVEK